MDKKRTVSIGVLLVILVVLAVLFFRKGGREEIKPSSEVTPPESELSSVKPGETRKITLFFPSEEDALLHTERREIRAHRSEDQQAKQAVEELLKGSKDGYLSPFPEETRLRELYITGEGVAYVDFSRELEQNHLSGSTSEMATVFSIVNSLTYNFKSIKKVFILIDGGERETLGGHISLVHPFFPQYDLIAE
ncbi:MAG: GerMN domain-containing protein [Candidatus Aminicenantes bacterium]